MNKYYNFLYAGAKVAYDKGADYLSHYSGYGNKEHHSESSDDDKINDYEGFLTIENYKDENNHSRLLNYVGFWKEYYEFFSQPTHIIDNIYLGSAFNAAQEDVLMNLNIKLVINATSEISEYYPDKFKYKRYKLYDNNKHSIKKYLHQSYDDIVEHNKFVDGNIFIHCFMGASRSASIVIYYLMRTTKNSEGKLMNFDEALKYILNKRPIVNPTFRFTKDLAASMLIIKKDQIF